MMKDIYFMISPIAYNLFILKIFWRINLGINHGQSLNLKVTDFSLKKKHEGDIMGIEFGEFKGHKMIILKKDDNDQYPFQFGKAKAKLIVENYNDIKKFAEEE